MLEKSGQVERKKIVCVPPSLSLLFVLVCKTQKKYKKNLSDVSVKWEHRIFTTTNEGYTFKYMHNNLYLVKYPYISRDE